MQESDILTKFSLLHRLLRVTALILRWLKRNKAQKTITVLSPDELRYAENL